MKNTALISVGKDIYYASEILFFVDSAAYRSEGQRLCDQRASGMPYEELDS